MPDPISIGESVQLTPDQVAQLQQPADAFPVGSQTVLNSEQATEARKQSGHFDPFTDFTAEQLAELHHQSPDFKLVESYAPRSDLQQVPGMNQKVADAYSMLRQRGDFGAQLDIKKVPGQLFDIAKGFGKQAWNYAQAVATPVGAAIADVAGASPETVSRMFGEGQRQVAENVAGTEAALQGLGKTVGAGSEWIKRRLKLSKPLAEFTPEEKVADLFDAVRSHKQLQEISRGQGPILQTVGSEVVKQLEDAGTPVRPEEVQKLAAGDPFSWYLMGKTFSGAGALVPEAVASRAAQAAQAAGNFAAKVGGKTVETAADVTRLGLDAAAVVAPTAAAVTGAVKGGTHGPLGVVTGATLGYKGGQVIASGLRKGATTAEKVSQIGEQISGAKPVISPVAQLGRDVLQSSPAAVGELGKGVAFDLGLAAVTSEETPEERAGLGIGTAFGALGAGRRVAGHVVSGQIIAPREYGVKQVTPSSGQFPTLDAMHTAAIADAAPGVAARLNAIRLFTKGASPNTDVFLAKDAPAMESALTQLGVSPEQAKQISAQEGFFTKSIPGKDGSERRVILATNVESAPHESFHAIQDVLGESANREIDKMVQSAYTPRWENEGNTYARRLVGLSGLQNKTWREAILDASGWGRAEAADKLARDAENQINTATGAVAKPSDVSAMAEGEWGRLLADAAKRNPGVPVDELQNNLWRDVLTPQEAHDVGDRYLARELAAENFDAVFKHGLGGDSGLIPKLARVVANVTSALGGEPLSGRTSEIGNVPLSYDVVNAVRGIRPVVEPKGNVAKPVISTGKSAQTVPTTPEAQQQAAEEARAIAAEAPDVIPPAPTTPVPPKPGQPAPTPLPTVASPRELLGKIAEAIATRSGVKINYSSAPGEPAASITSTRPIRRSVIEAFRTMPEAARALWEKNFFPERVIKTKSGYQVLGWAPEVFAANAHKLAGTLIDAGVASPYELNPAERSFSSQGWQDLYNDVATFVNNQMGGRTGAGGELNVPKSITAQGYTAPAVTGAPEPIDQRKADFINMLFHFKLPETPRITSGKLPLNIAGQEVSTATQPGRLVSPVTPRAPYSGASAEKLGISGREILETNPLRNEIEQAAASKGIDMPSMIEAIQRLDLAHIKEVSGAPELPQFRGNTLTLTGGFQPASEAITKIRDESFWNSIKNYSGKFGGGITGWAFEVGASAKTPQDVQAFRDANREWGELGREAMRNKDYDSAAQLLTKAQAAREAFEVATGQKIDGSGGASGASDMMRSKDPNYIPPVLEKPELLGQAQPKNPEVEKVAEEYLKGKSFKPMAPRIVPLNAEIAKDIADYYDQAKSEPANPAVLNSYNALSAETIDQYKKIIDAGYKIEPWTDKGEPYANSAAMTADVRNNKHLFFKPTGSDIKGENLMLRPSGIEKFNINDIFRAVHDFFGHAKEGHQFGPQGELNAWKEHSAMYSPEAQGALAAETLAQNSWVNFGKHLRDEAGNVPLKGAAGFQPLAERPFADQKNIVIPPNLIDLAREQVPIEDARTTRRFVQTLGQAQPARDVHEDFSERYDRQGSSLLDEFKKSPHGEISWDKIPAARLKKIWLDYGKTGVVRDEKGLEKIADKMLDNIARFSVTTDLSGHTPNDPQMVAEGLGHTLPSGGGEEGKPPVNEDFYNWLGDKFSDFGLRPLQMAYEKIYSAKSAEEKLQEIDRALNIVHQRSDLAGVFVEGGSKTLDEIASQGGYAPHSKPTNNDYIGYKGQFQPKKKEEEFKLRPASSGFSKAWILPDGTPVQLGGQWHHDWLNEATAIRKQYGIKKGTADEDDTRSEALRKGFSRINYDARTGSLTVEVREKDLDNLRGPLTKFIETNLPQIDKIQMYLFDNKVSHVADSGFANLFDKPKAERMAAIPFLFAPGDITEVSPQATKGALSEQAAPGAMPVRGQSQPKKSDELYYITPEKNLPNILKEGIKPAKPKDFDDEHAVYLFPDRAHMDDGVANWLADRYPEDTRLVAIKVDPTGLTFEPAVVDWEVKHKTTIPVKNILGHESLDDYPAPFFPNKKAMKFSGQSQPPAEQKTFEEFSGKEPLGTMALSNMTKDEVSNYYPEAVIARKKFDPIPSEIADSPLAKQAGDETKAISAYADKLVDFANEYKDDPSFAEGADWYRKFVPQLKKQFGKDSSVMAELLAATSPRTDVASNFAYALDALEGMRSGRFAKQVAKFEEGLRKLEGENWRPWYDKELKAGNIPAPPAEPTPAAFLEHWIATYDLKPRQSNGKLYGTHSNRILQVLARRWVDLNTGPKTRTFVSNLLGTGHDATIDVWADRTMRRLGYQDFSDRWRILPQNAAPVSDTDFHFSQKAFAAAAKRLGMKPDALQGALWFAEKKHWAKNGWARLDLGSFSKEITKVPMLRRGIEQRSAVSKLVPKGPAATTGELGFSIEPRKYK